ncbi:MAG: transposase [Caldilineaceae bacterium SB0666_bin_21]|nr:transposase [Caldilineaceae bacterium SB0666_bin_21]
MSAPSFSDRVAQLAAAPPWSAIRLWRGWWWRPWPCRRSQVRDDRRIGTGARPRGHGRSLGCAPGTGSGPLRESATAGPRTPPRHNLARALWTLRDACLLFLADPAVPFTNNLAEQAMCRAKLQMKILGCFRTRAGAERFAHMRGLVETSRKREWYLLDFLWQGPDAAAPQPHSVPP